MPYDSEIFQPFARLYYSDSGIRVCGQHFHFGRKYNRVRQSLIRKSGQFICWKFTPLFTLWLFGPSLVKIRTMKPQEQRDLFPGALEMMILQTLKRKPLHGYALAQHIKQTSEDLLEVEEGSLYPALQRMLKAGWVKAEWGISATNRRVRTYQLTSAGRKHVQAEVSRFERM